MDLGGFVFQDGVAFIHNDGGAGYGNTAVGLNALVSATPGSPYSSSGSRNSAFGEDALRSNTTGAFNTASGPDALSMNTAGSSNTASGSSALLRNTKGHANTAIGSGTLAFNTTSSRNTASGFSALLNNTGSNNTASGAGALVGNNTGSNNTANGAGALDSNSTGSYNTAIGSGAGSSWTTGSSNIAVGVGAYGVPGESATIRIGGSGNQIRTFIEDISGTTVSGVQVMIAGDDQLGVATSSARFKQDIRDLEGVSDQLLDLRPISFRYKNDPANDNPNPIEYGLIAEEVAEIFPELVVNDEEGKPFTVRYHLLTPLLLAEIQRQDKSLRNQNQEIADLHKQMSDRDRVVAELHRRLERLTKGRRSR